MYHHDVEASSSLWRTEGHVRPRAPIGGDYWDLQFTAGKTQVKVGANAFLPSFKMWASSFECLVAAPAFTTGY